MSIGITGITKGPKGGYHPEKKVDKQTFADSLRGEPVGFEEAMTELRRDTIESILRTARKPGEKVVKVAAVADPNAKPLAKVKGFATFLRFIKGSNITELKDKLGLAKDELSKYGAYIYTVDPFSLNLSNVVPEGYTDWSDGVTRRELHNLSQKHGVDVTYHPDYPASSSPIIQFRILEEVPYIGQPRFLKPGETV
jgi:hypothetical protein